MGRVTVRDYFYIFLLSLCKTQLYLLAGKSNAIQPKLTDYVIFCEKQRRFERLTQAPYGGPLFTKLVLLSRQEIHIS